MRGVAGWVGTAVVGAALWLPAPAAWAHAVLVSSSPGAHQSVGHGAMHVTLKFNSRVDGTRSTLVLVDGRGNTRPLTALPQTSLDTLQANIGSIAMGSYTLRWQALASDGHITRGEIPFQVH